MELFYALAHHGTVALAQTNLHPLADGAAVNASYGNTTHIVGVVERRDEHLGLALVGGGSGDVFEDCIEKWGDIVGGFAPVGAHPSVFGRAVDGGEVELVLGSVEVEHQVEHHFLHLVGAAVGLVDLVDHHYGLQAHLDGFLEHETRLGHRALEGVDQQQTAVGHIEHALHLAAEVGVARSVYDIDFGVFVVDGNVLRENRYAALALEVVVVENEFAGVLVFAEKISGEQHFIDQRGLAVVHVGYDGDVTDVLHVDLLQNFNLQR